MLVANICTGPFSIEHSLGIIPSTPSQTGTEFRISCLQGFSASVQTGSLICDDNNVWLNQPQCQPSTCTGPFSIEHSLAVLPSASSLSGTQFAISCQAGFSPTQETGTLICDGDNVWVNQPQCQANTCVGPFNIEHSQSIITSGPSPSGTQFTLSCLEGYSPTEETGTVICDINNVWLNQPQCQANICTGPFNIEHSVSITPSSPSPSGTQFTISCQEGYSATQQTGTIICDINKVWLNMPQCQANICNGPFNIEHSLVITPSVSSPSGTQFSLTCLEGFSPSIQTGSLICDDNNVWLNQPQCQPNTCVGPFNIEHSLSIIMSGPSPSGTQFTLSCKEGYSPTDETGTIICDEDNVWVNQPQCQPNTCAGPFNIENSQSITPAAPSQSGTQFSLTCLLGFSATSSTGSMICDINNVWQNMPQCRANTCRGPFNIEHSQSITPSSPSPSGTQFSISCQVGYSPTEETGSLICSGNSVWQNQPQCEPNTCNGPFNIEHSLSITPSVPSQSGTQFSLICLEGFSATSSTGSMICDDNNVWLNIPHCQANMCTGPFSIGHSQSITPRVPSQSGTQFTISCLQGYSATEETGSIICGEDNMWLNQPQCQANICTGPINIEHSLGVLPTIASPSGTQFSLTCLEGFSPTTSTGSMICGTDNVWANQPRCQPNTCVGPFNIEHSATITPSGPSPSGTQFTISCMDGYSPTEETGTIICGDDNVWRNQPRCQGNQRKKIHNRF